MRQLNLQCMPPHERLIRKLQGLTDVSAEATEAVRALPLTLRIIDENADVVCEGDTPTACCLLVEGYVFRYKMVGQGRRQIMSLHVPGDVPNLQSLHLWVMDHSLGAISPSTVAYIPHASLRDLMRRHPRVSDALWRDSLIDAVICREWLSNVGRRSAFERAAHLMCEVFVKLQAAGIGESDRCPFPLTQVDLADALGISVVHVNRTVQALRAEGLIVLQGRRLHIPDWHALAAVADFQPAYLHLKGAKAA